MGIGAAGGGAIGVGRVTSTGMQMIQNRRMQRREHEHQASQQQNQFGHDLSMQENMFGHNTAMQQNQFGHELGKQGVEHGHQTAMQEAMFGHQTEMQGTQHAHDLMMSSTAHQRAVADKQAAGLNPALGLMKGGMQGAGQPGGAQSPAPSAEKQVLDNVIRRMQSQKSRLIRR